jgi:hypothetical protein
MQSFSGVPQDTKTTNLEVVLNWGGELRRLVR